MKTINLMLFTLLFSFTGSAFAEKPEAKNFKAAEAEEACCTPPVNTTTTCPDVQKEDCQKTALIKTNSFFKSIGGPSEQPKATRDQ